jgi:hypothetical protein
MNMQLRIEAKFFSGHAREAVMRLADLAIFESQGEFTMALVGDVVVSAGPRQQRGRRRSR